MYNNNGLGLKGLVNLEDWQKIQDSFSEVLGITLRTADLNGSLLTEISNPTQLCNKILAKTSIDTEFCSCCPLKIKKKINIREETNLKCPFDLDIFILPIKAFGNRIVAHIISGPVILQARKDKSEYAKYAEKAGIDSEKLIDALIEINVFSYSRIHSINTLLSDIFSYMAQTGYHKKRLGEITPKVIEMDPLFSSYYEEKVLNTLLNTCTIAFNADSGSVMIVDKNTKHLHIKVASKLDEEIVKNTAVKMGEGIAGIAAANTESIILPEDRGKNGLSKKMKRGYIKSSMIVPFNKPNKYNVYGVLNLNIVRKDRRFTEKDIALAKGLINLASISIALLPVK